MAHVTPIDITHIPELVKIAEEVEATRTSRELRRENKPVAVIMPVTKSAPQKKQEKPKADYEAFQKAAGSWKDMDVEKFKADISASRRLVSTRPLVKL